MLNQHVTGFPKYLKMTALAFVLFTASSAYAGLSLIPVDVAMDGNDLYFVLEEPCQIEFLRVSALADRDKAKRTVPIRVKALWLLGYDMSTPPEKRRYLNLKQIEYGRKLTEFPRVEGPAALQKNVEYFIEIDAPGKIARDVFIITDDNKALMPRPAFERQKERTYSVSTDKDGDKIFVPKKKAKNK